jgi:hypothetical protein
MTRLSCHSECFGTFHEGDEIVGRRSAGVERQPAPVVGQFEIRTGLTGGCIWHWPLRYSQHGRNLQVPPLRCAAQSDLRKSCRRVETPNGRLQDLWSRNGVLGKLNDAHLQAKEAFHRRPFQWLLTDPLPETSPPRCYLGRVLINMPIRRLVRVRFGTVTGPQTRGALLPRSAHGGPPGANSARSAYRSKADLRSRPLEVGVVPEAAFAARKCPRKPISTTGAGTIAGATETPVALYAVGVGGAQPFDLGALWLWSSFACEGDDRSRHFLLFARSRYS